MDFLYPLRASSISPKSEIAPSHEALAEEEEEPLAEDESLTDILSELHEIFGEHEIPMDEYETSVEEHDFIEEHDDFAEEPDFFIEEHEITDITEPIELPSKTTPTVPVKDTSRTKQPYILELHPDGRKIRFTKTTKLNSYWAKSFGRFGTESIYWDKKGQLTLEQSDDGWFVIPNANAMNDTILNNKSIVSPKKLHEDDILGVGNEAKGIIKTPMRVKLIPPK